jgi:hypothetical protein
MIKLRLLRSKMVQELNAGIADNLVRYRSGDFHFLEADPSNYFEIDQELDEQKMALVDCESEDHKEVDCCMHIHEAMGQIPPYLARDSRLWVYLTHTLLLGYSRKRWPIPEDDEKAVAHIRKHFFATGARGIERDNAASRLWWMATLCGRINGLTMKEALTSFLHQYDVRANIIERPTTSQSIPVFSAVIKKLDESYKGDQKLFEREKFRQVMKELNLKGGVKLLGALDEKEIGKIVDECLK